MSCDKVEIKLQLTATMTELLMAVSTLLRYFKGDIVMASVDGHGTDTYVYLQV